MKPALQFLLAGAAAFVFVLLLLSLLSLLLRLVRKKNRTHAATARVAVSRSASSFPEDCSSFDPSLPPLSLALLSSATRGFHRDLIVGDGAFGLVYKALLPDGTAVAVKCLSPDYASQGLREFKAEVETLGRLQHPNLCRFLGYCSSGPFQRLLVYEFLPLGSLDLWLHEAPPTPPLPFPARLHVARGVAAGLAFLHHGCNPPVIHRDIKSGNVLLADGFAARIADFGLARYLELSRSHVSTQVAGTMGYMPPEYRDGATTATAKADVYSFGVLLLEILSGRRPNLPVPFDDGDGRRREVGMVWWARRMAEEGRELAMAQDGMDGADGTVVRSFVAVALACTVETPKHRPTMTEVVELLVAVAPAVDGVV